MKLGVTICFICAVYIAIGNTTAQSILGECVNETLVLGDDCQARPLHDNFFTLLENLIKRDTALVVLTLTIPDVDPNVRNHHRFDLIKTDLGQILLTLKSQMEFLTLDLPLLSDKVERQSMELIHSPHGCLSNITLNDTLVKNWLLCGLTKIEDGIERLSIRKLCFAKPYEEPDDWYLFRDTYYHECSDSPIINSEWITLIEDDLVMFGKRVLNFGVSILTILCVVVMTIHRRLFHTKARLFLSKLEKSEEKICQLVKRSDPESDEVKLSPEKINFPYLKLELENLIKSNQRTVQCIRGRRTDQWTNITDKEQMYTIDVTGFWFDIGNDELISHNSFGLLTFLKTSIGAIIGGGYNRHKNDVRSFRTACYFLLHVLIFLIVTLGIIIPVFLFYKVDPFHTLLDGLIGLSIFIIVPLSMIVTRATLGFCRDEIINSTQMILLETTFFFFAFFVVAILSRVIVILVIGLALQSSPNNYTLISLTVLFVLTNGYLQLQKTHQRYLAFLDMCMKEINELLDEKDTLKEPVFKNRVIPPNVGNDMWPKKEEGKNSLLLKMKNQIVLFYMPNGDSAINKDLFLDLCKADTNHSPGHLQYIALIDIIKFIFWGCVVSGILFIQFIIAEGFDSSLYNQAPGALFGGLLPTLFNSVLFQSQTKKQNANLTRLLNEARKRFEKEYRVTDLEINGYPKVCNKSDGVWERICIKKSPCSGCCCLQPEILFEDQDSKTENTYINEETEGGKSEGRTRGNLQRVYRGEGKSGYSAMNPGFTNGSDKV